MSAEPRIFLWEAGAHCGTAGTRERAFEMAGEFLGAGAGALVEEARLALTAGSGGGMVPAHQRTGQAWRGRMLEGRPSWRPCTAEPA